MNRPVLVTGFGPFPGVVDNPSARLARQVHGCRAGSSPVVGLVLPVRWRVGPLMAIEAARALDARAVVGLGVATSRSGVHVERLAVRRTDGRADVVGEVLPLPPGEPTVAATLDVDRLAAALDAVVSSDAGNYVCNAWLYQVVPALVGRPVGFVHLPSEGLSPARLLAGLAALLD